MKKTVIIIIIIIIERVLLKRREVEKLQEHCTSVNVTKNRCSADSVQVS